MVSISLPKSTVGRLERERKLRGQSRSAFIASMIDKVAEDQRWERIYKRGAKTARKFGITSEDDVDRILHET